MTLPVPHTKVSNNTKISKYWLGCEMMWLSPHLPQELTKTMENLSV